jgi:hypothetical protein
MGQSLNRPPARALGASLRLQLPVAEPACRQGHRRGPIRPEPQFSEPAFRQGLWCPHRSGPSSRRNGPPPEPLMPRPSGRRQSPKRPPPEAASYHARRLLPNRRNGTSPLAPGHLHCQIPIAETAFRLRPPATMPIGYFPIPETTLRWRPPVTVPVCYIPMAESSFRLSPPATMPVGYRPIVESALR